MSALALSTNDGTNMKKRVDAHSFKSTMTAEVLVELATDLSHRPTSAEPPREDGPARSRSPCDRWPSTNAATARRAARGHRRSRCRTGCREYRCRQCGSRTLQSRDGSARRPRREVSIGEAAHLALGYFHVCVALSAGGVSCFGSNGWGELGNDDLGSEPEPSPVTAMGISNTRQLAAGQQFTCAILEDRGVACWGDNRNGQLGDGSTSFSTTPKTIAGFGDVAQIAAGRKHTCAVTLDGALYCWGRNEEGQLGDGTNTERHVPTLVEGLSGVQQVALGDLHTCALLDSGAVRCFGSNTNGQLGDGTTDDTDRPTYVLWE